MPGMPKTQTLGPKKIQGHAHASIGYLHKVPWIVGGESKFRGQESSNFIKKVYNNITTI